MAISWTWWDKSDAWNYALNVAPGLDWFAYRNLSLGATLHFGYTDDFGYGADASLDEAEVITVRAGLRIGENVPIAAGVSWYPQLGAGFEYVELRDEIVKGRSLSIAANPFGVPSTTQVGTWVELFAPILLHPKPHLFVGAGPDIFHDFGSVRGGPDIGGQRTTLGAGVVVGTWWGGLATAAAADTTATNRARRFGEANQIVLSGEMTAGAAWTTYAGVSSSSTTLTIAPGIDYFVVNHFSVGGAFSVRSGHITGINPSAGYPVSDDVASVGGTLRFGVDLPMSTWLSFYPRGSISAGVVRYDEKSSNGENSYSVNVISVGLYAPMLLHLAPHAFVGFGPSVARDLDSAIPHSRIESRSTSAGASLVVGGWID